MSPRLYLETTIPSYLTALPSRDLVVAAHQEITREWWARRRTDFKVFISQLVIRECSRGDQDAAARRLVVLDGIPLLDEDDRVYELAAALTTGLGIPARAAADAIHVAVAVLHGMDYLLTWNCTHLANAELRSAIEEICRSSGYVAPVICTPEELMGVAKDVE